MTEERAHDDTGAADGPEDEPVRTGVDRVDAVIDDVSGLADRPVDEHVAVFESAHDRLRRALDAPSDDGPPDDAE
jgi:hypothetical protein